jgi:hypothetical protein
MPEIEDINVWDELTTGLNIRGANFSDYVDVDNEISICEISVMQTDEEVNESQILVLEVEDSEETDEYEIDSQESEEPVKMIETLTAISTLRKYTTQSDKMESIHALLDKIESDIHNFRIKNLKQKKITDYLLSD